MVKNNTDKVRVAVLFGGRSTEHEISLLSAQNVISALDKEKYQPVLIGIDKDGKWYYQDDSLQLLAHTDPKKIGLAQKDKAVIFNQNANEHNVSLISDSAVQPGFDVIFPVLHGTYGEDGAIQGLAKLANIPCVGAGILGSAIGMDKEIMKRLLRDADIPNAPFATVRVSDETWPLYDDLSQQFGSVMFVKPANLGSSVGVSKVDNGTSYTKAIEKALQYDSKVIIEQQIIGRELECAVLGNEEPMASIPGEVVPKDGFYSYESKYIDESGAELLIPADLTKAASDRVRQMAIRTYKILECSGMARVDMFMTENGTLFINEINTIPGFTNISMYPKLWEISGISNSDLIDRLINLAFDQHNKFNRLKLSF